MASDEIGAQLFADVDGRLYLVFSDNLEGYCVPNERGPEMEARLCRGSSEPPRDQDWTGCGQRELLFKVRMPRPRRRRSGPRS